MLNKLQVIEGIREINPTARLDWLGRFDLGALRRYLEHLEVTHWLLGCPAEPDQAYPCSRFA